MEPFSSISFESPSKNPNDWRWLEPKPSEWRPQVCRDGNTVKVTFYTYSGLGVDTIFQHEDRYESGHYDFGSTNLEVSTGRGGSIF